MPSKKKSKKKPARKSAKNVRRPAVKAKKSLRSAKKKTAKKKVATKKARGRKKRPSVSAETDVKREFRRRNTAAAARQSSDFKGLSRTEEAGSESVDELVEEGNIFEAGAIAGVEEADSSDEREVHTHEVPEDDVPEEYLDED